MNSKSKMSGRRIDRKRWNWKDENDIEPINDDIITMFETLLDSECGVTHYEEQGRSQSRRANTTRIVSWVIIAGITFLTVGVIVSLINKMIL